MNALDDPLSYLKSLASLKDEAIELGFAALALSALQHEGINAGRYLHHLEQLVKDVEARYLELSKKSETDSAALRHQALSQVIADDYGYLGDVSSYDDLQNASLIKVIDRAQGLPITLAILYIHVGRALGWDVEGLNFPGHFLCRLSYQGERIIFDPFHGGQATEASGMRRLIKRALGDDAELSSSYYEPATNRTILIRLENNLKHRKIDASDYKGALEHVERMRLFAPDDYRLLLDEGVLLAKLERAKAAMKALSAYIEAAPQGRGRYEAEILLSELSQKLN